MADRTSGSSRGADGKAERRRDAGGRFVGRRPSRRRVGTSRAGRRGLSHYANKSHPALVAILTVVEHRLGRLEAERDGREWRDPEHVRRANMHGVERKRAGVKADRLRAIDAAVRHFAAKRRSPEVGEFHERVKEELGGPIPVRALYRKPYVSAWRPDLARPEGPAHRSPMALANAKLSRRALIGFILRAGGRIDALQVARRAALVAQSDEEGWTPLPRR